MVLYLDIVVVTNFIINYCFLKLIYILFHEKVNILRIILASFISILLLFSFFTNYIIFNIIKIFGGAFIVFIGFKFINKIRFVIILSLYYILQFTFIGLLSIFNIKGIFIFLILFITCLLLMVYSKKRHIFSELTYKIIVEIENDTIEINGFLDTGNTASYLDTPIIFINNKYYKTNYKIYNQVLIKTVDSIKYIPCYKPKKIYFIENNKKIAKECLICFCELDDNECLLNNLLFC